MTNDLDECEHGMPDSNCIQCALKQVYVNLEELQGIADYCAEQRDINQLVDDNIDDVVHLLNSIKSFLNRVNPEIECWKRVVTQLTYEKAMIETKYEYYERGIKSIVKHCIDCPETAGFASHLLDNTVEIPIECVREENSK